MSDEDTQRKYIEVLRESEAKYRTLFETIDEGFCVIEMIYDEAGVSVDYRFLEVNQVFERQTGLKDVTGKRGSELVPGTERYWLETYGHVAQTGEPLRFENYHAATRRWYQVYASRVDGGSSHQVSIVFDNITERKQRERHQAFLLELSDTLRAETGVEAVGNRAVHMIAEQLGVDRVYLVTLTPGDDTVVVTHEARREDMPPLHGSYHGSDFPSAIKELFERTIVYNDVGTDARLTDLDRLSFAGLGAVGFIAAPIRRGSEAMIWAAGALSTQPREWTATDVALFEDAVERTWAAVERARAEAALQQAYDVLEQRVQERTAELAEANDARAALLQRVITAQEEERQRIARELHDGLGQFLAALTVRLSALEGQAESLPEVQHGLAGARRIARQVDNELDLLTLELRPPALNDLGLQEALHEYTQHWTATSSVPVDTFIQGIEHTRLPSMVETTIYRIVQEALNNTLKYAQATMVSIIVERRDDQLNVVIEDNGVGFDQQAVRRERRSGRQVGLIGMHERATLMGGKLTIDTDPGTGTTIYLRIPLDML